MWGDVHPKLPSEQIQLWAIHGDDSCACPSQGGSWKRAVVYLFPYKALGQPSEGSRSRARAMEGGSCPTRGAFGALCIGVTCVQGARQAGWMRRREAAGVTEQRKHRRLRKVPQVLFPCLSPPWASACSLCGTRDTGGWTHLLLRESSSAGNAEGRRNTGMGDPFICCNI